MLIMTALVDSGRSHPILILAIPVAGCTRKSDAKASSTVMKPAQVKVVLVPGGSQPYFQPWKTAGVQAKADFGLGDVTFNENPGWDQTKQNNVLTSPAAQGYNAFGVFGIAPENINTTFDSLERQGFHVASLASCPAGSADDADCCLSTDVQQAAYKAAQAAIAAVSRAKWLAAACDILVIDEPTVGIDVRTKAAFHKLIAGLAEEGMAILLISPDLPEVVTLADRSAVMGDFTLRGELVNDRDYDRMSQAIIRLIHPGARAAA